MTDKKLVLFFPGRGMPLKRYISYFKDIELVENSDKVDEKMPILCHSRGLEHAIQYCVKNNINPLIVSMDGVQIDIPNHIRVVNFRPECKQPLGDEWMYQTTIYYEKDTHHPYMVKLIRDMILELLIGCQR